MDAKLFMELFRGRIDAYGSGSGVCVKEKLTDAVIDGHLAGHKRVGCYPLAPDIMDGSGTWWIAADIDIEELGYAALVAEAIEHLGIPCYVERSKSKGYHVWVFFSEPIEAKWARALIKYGSDVLEKDTGDKIYEMYPRQNTIKRPVDYPDGLYGYGNYINLPLFGADVPHGKTAFLNAMDHYKPYPDQWEFLKSIKRVSPEHVMDLVKMGELTEATEAREPKRERAPQDTETLGVSGLLADMMEKCAFCREFLPNTGGMHEELWYRWLTQMVCFEGGEDLAYRLSSDSPKFDDEITRKKIEHAKEAKGKGLAPYTCAEIIDCQGWTSPECETCYAHPSRRNASPAGLPYILKALEFEKQKVLPGSVTILTEVAQTVPANEDENEDEAQANDEDYNVPSTIQSTIQPMFPAIAWRGVWEDFRLAHTNTTEAPDEFLFASVSSVIGAVMGRKAWLWYARRLYPNYYFSIVGATARSRKTTVADKAHDLLSRTDPNVLYYRGIASAEGFIQILSPLYDKDEAELDELIQAGSLQLDDAPARYRAGKARLAENVAEFEGMRMLGHIGEFSSLLKKASKESTQGLTEALIDAYDNPPKLDNPTRTSPLSAFKPSVSVLTTTTQGRLCRHLMKEDIEGGFANRFAYFIGDRKRPISLPPEPITEHLNRCVANIVQARRKWRDTQFHLLEDTFKLWDDFYNWWYYINDGDTVDHITGRLPDHAMKLALQYAIVENSAPEILPEQMAAAIAVSKYWYECIQRLFTGFGLTEHQQVERQILDAISNGGKSKEELYKVFSRHIDAKQLNTAIENLQKVNRIVLEKKKAEGRGKRPKTVFRLSENACNPSQ